jgi:hypothetical protein
MRTFKNSELKTFEQILRLRQDSLKRVLARFLKKHYPKVVETKDYIFAEGEIPIALVAHMDTVFKNPPEEIFFDPRLNAMISPDGLGADDRAGVFAILQIIQSGFKPHIIFTTDEEIGGIGAQALANIQCPFKDLRYIIELDRRGAQDCVFYNCENPEFTDYVEAFGFTWAWGSFSDISFICPAWKIAGVNLSVGYCDEHSLSEVLYVGYLLSTIDKVKRMLSEKNIPQFEYKEINLNNFSKTKIWDSPYNYGIYNETGGLIKCSGCDDHYMDIEMFPVVLLNGETGFYCPNCIAKIAWCKTCGSAYETNSLEDIKVGECIKCIELKEKKK